MSCINPYPLTTFSRYGVRINIDIDCRHCLNCMIKRQQQVEFLAKKELNTCYRSGRSASFVTLTYDDSHLPTNEDGLVTLRRSDVQKFMKNMRRQMEYYNEKKEFKYLYCGEYGDGSHSTSRSGVSTHRPHYHIVFIGLGPVDIKKYTRKLWQHGLCDIGPLGQGGIRYLCKYMTKACPDKDVKTFREIMNVQNPFFYHSIGLGKQWIIENMDKIVEDGFTFNIAGKRQLFPKYIMQFVAWHTNTNYIKYVKEFLANEVVPKAKVKGISYSQYDFENSYVKYKTMVACLRSQNKPVNDITLSKHWVKPVHNIDRVPHSDTVNKIINELCS